MGVVAVENQPELHVDPWCLREVGLNVEALAQSESLFALSNGHIGLRGNLDEGEPHALPGTYLNSFYELRPLPYAEAGYGYPESGQTIVNITNGKHIRLMVDDEPFDVRYGDLRSHERVLDFRAGTLTRTADWTSPAGRRIRLQSRRLVSFAQRAVAAVEYVVEPVDHEARFIVQSELVANEALPPQAPDPRAAAILEHPLEALEQVVNGRGAMLVHRTRRSGLQMAAAMDHQIEGPGRVEVDVDATQDWARTTAVCVVPPGERLRIVKLLAYGWSSLRSLPALRDQVAAAITGAAYTGFDGLAEQQREFLDGFWRTADVVVEGDAEIQQAVRFGLFHLLQAGARAERRADPGEGADRPRLRRPHLLGHRGLRVARADLHLPTGGRRRAALAALQPRPGPPPSRRAQPRGCDVPLADDQWPRVLRLLAGRDRGLPRQRRRRLRVRALPRGHRRRDAGGRGGARRPRRHRPAVDVARSPRPRGVWHIDGVTGPDEYSALADDNVFTNLMAARNLRAAAGAVNRHSEQARDRLGVTLEETAAWRSAAESVHIPYDDQLGVHPQSELFTRYQEWDFEGNRGRYPLLLHVPYFDLYRCQVVKQADLVLAMQWCGDAFTPEQKARNVDYYERRTVRDSSLSACTQAVLAAEVGHLELAHDYAYEAALVDLGDIHHNTGDGLHMASLAGAWIALVAGFGGMRDHDGHLWFDPALPEKIGRLTFNLQWRGARIVVDVTHTRVTYELNGESTAAVTLRHAGEDISIEPGQRVSRDLHERQPLLPRPSQPPGREPLHRTLRG